MSKTSFKAVVFVLLMALPGHALDSNLFLKMHKGDLSSICSQEMGAGFEKALYYFAFADLTTNSNVDFKGYNEFMKRQVDAFETASNTFKSDTANLETTVNTFLITWLKWYWNKHIQYFLKISKTAKFEALNDAAFTDPEKPLMTLTLEIDENSIRTLATHINGNKDSAKVGKDIVAMIEAVRPEFIKLLSGMVSKETKIDVEGYETAKIYINELVHLFPKKEVYNAIFKVSGDIEAVAGGAFATIELFDNINGMENFYEDGMYVEGKFLQNKPIDLSGSIFQSLQLNDGFTFSAEFYTWFNKLKVNDESITDEPTYNANIFAHWYIYFLYFFLAQSKKIPSNSKIAAIGDIMTGYMLQADNCFKDDIESDACLIKDQFTRDQFTRNYVLMYNILLTTGTANNMAKAKTDVPKLTYWDIQVDVYGVKGDWVEIIQKGIEKNAIRELLVEIKTSYITIENDLVTKANPKPTTFGAKHLLFKQQISTIITKIITDDIRLRLAKALVSFKDMDKLSNKLTKIMINEKDELLQRVYFELFVSVTNDLLSKKVTQGNLSKEENEFITAFIPIFQKNIMITMGERTPDSLARGFIEYMKITLLERGSPEPLYYYNEVANLFRGYDLVVFGYYNLKKTDDKAYFAGKMKYHLLINDEKKVDEYYVTDAFLINNIFGFEAMEDFLELWEFFVMDKSLQDVIKQKHNKAFLTIYNMLYRFLASIRFINIEISIDTYETIFQAALKCMATRLDKVVPDSKENRMEECPLNYSETVEVFYILLAFFLKKDSQTFSALYKTNLALISKYPPVIIDNFLKVIIKHSELNQFFKEFCLTEKTTSAVYKEKPICLAYNIVIRSMEYLDIEANQDNGNKDLEAGFVGYINSAIKLELEYLKDNKADKFARSLVWGSVSTLLLIDTKNYVFSKLLDESRINGFVLIKQGGKAPTNPTTVLEKEKAAYELWVTAVDMEAPTASPEDIKSAAEFAKEYLQRRFTTQFYTTMDDELRIEIMAYYKEQTPFYIVSGQFVPDLAEVFLKYANEAKYFEAVGRDMINSGKFLSTLRMTKKPNIVQIIIQTALAEGQPTKDALIGAIYSYTETAIAKKEKLIITEEHSDIKIENLEGKTEIEKKLITVNSNENARISAFSNLIENKITKILDEGSSQTSINFKTNIKIGLTSSSEVKIAQKKDQKIVEQINQTFATIIKNAGTNLRPAQKDDEDILVEDPQKERRASSSRKIVLLEFEAEGDDSPEMINKQFEDFMKQRGYSNMKLVTGGNVGSTNQETGEILSMQTINNVDSMGGLLSSQSLVKTYTVTKSEIKTVNVANLNFI